MGGGGTIRKKKRAKKGLEGTRKKTLDNAIGKFLWGGRKGLQGGRRGSENLIRKGRKGGHAGGEENVRTKKREDLGKV